MNDTITLEQFRQIKNEMQGLIEKIDSITKTELIKEFLVVQKELLSYNLSSIPASEWKDMAFLSPNILDYIKDENNFKPEPLDFSKTHANIDFTYFKIDKYNVCNYNFHNCNVSNIDEASKFDEKWFDKETIEKNKNIFLSDNFSDEIKDKIYNGNFSYEEWYSLPDNLFEEILSYKYVNRFIISDNYLDPLCELTDVLGNTMTRELYLKHKDQLKEIIKHNNGMNLDEEGINLINSFNDINIEDIYNNMTNIIEILQLNDSFPISNYNIDNTKLKSCIIKHLCNTTYHIDEIKANFSLDDYLNDLDKKFIIETHIKNNGLKYLNNYSKVLNGANIEFDKEVVLSAFYKTINKINHYRDIDDLLAGSSVIDYGKYFSEKEIKQLVKCMLLYDDSAWDLTSQMSQLKKIFSKFNIDYNDMKEEFVQCFKRMQNIKKLKFNISAFLATVNGIFPVSDFLTDDQLKEYVEYYLKEKDSRSLKGILPYVDVQNIISQIDYSTVQSYIHSMIESIISGKYESFFRDICYKVDFNSYIDKNWLKNIIYEKFDDFNKDVINNKDNFYSITRISDYCNISIVDLLDKNQVKNIINDLYNQDSYETAGMLDYLIRILKTEWLEFIDKDFMRNILENEIVNNNRLGVDKLYNFLQDEMYNLIDDKIMNHVENLIFNSQIQEYLYQKYDITKFVNSSHIPNILNFLINKEELNTELINCLVGEHKLEDYLDDEIITKWIENEKAKEEKKYEKILELAVSVDVDKFISPKCQKIVKVYKNSNSSLKFHFLNFFKNIDIEMLDISKINEIEGLLLRIEYSNSTEIRRIGDNLIVQLLQLDNPTEKYEKIENIFLKNNIPYVGKIFSVFQILRDYKIPPESSRVLAKQSNFGRQVTIFSDLLKCAVKSGNRDLKEYIEGIEKGNELFLLVSSEQVKYEELAEEQTELLNNYINQLYVLYENTKKGQKEPIVRTENALTNIQFLIKAFSSNGKFDYNLPDKIVRMFGHFAGYNSIEDVKKDLEKSLKEAHNKGIENANKPFKLEDGDFIKGINDLKYLGNILQNGSIASDFLGDSATSNNTPLDTDLSIINGEYTTINEAIKSTYTKETYGGIMIVLKHRKGRFLRTRRDLHESDQSIDEKLDKDRLEAFYTGESTRYGIRTGFPSSEIDYILVISYNNRIGFEIARNGFYIPVVDRSGKLVFTIDDYNKLREQMNGLSKYGVDDFNLSSSLDNDVVSTVAKTLENNEKDTASKRQKVQEAIARAMGRLNLGLRDSISKDLTPGFVELIDTGSTGRGTNVPNDGDFDFMMKVDQSFMVDQEKLEELKKEIRKEFKYIAKDESNNGNFRYKGVTIEGLDEPVDIDITFVVKTNKVTYSTDMCVRDRLNTIKEQHPDKYDLVIANIIVAKKILKKFDVYKNKSNHDNPQGGLGGIGVENWILQHGGSFEEAARSFLKEANGKSFEDFQKAYPVWDFGENHMGEKHEFLYDDYIYNMDPKGYTKMQNALQYYLDNINTIDLTNIESINKTI